MGHGRKGLEAERHGLPDRPAEKDKEGDDEKGDLDARVRGHSDGQIHLVPDGRGDGNCLAALQPSDHAVDAVNQVAGADGDQDAGRDQDEAGSNGA